MTLTEGRARPHKIKVGHGQDWGLGIQQEDGLEVKHFNKNKDNQVQAGVSDIFKYYNFKLTFMMLIHFLPQRTLRISSHP